MSQDIFTALNLFKVSQSWIEDGSALIKHFRCLRSALAFNDQPYQSNLEGLPFLVFFLLKPNQKVEIFLT